MRFMATWLVNKKNVASAVRKSDLSHAHVWEEGKGVCGLRRVKGFEG